MEVHLKVRCLTGHDFTVPALLEETVGSLKRRISDMREFDSSIYLLYFGPERLDDYKRLSFYGIKDRSYLEMIHYIQNTKVSKFLAGTILRKENIPPYPCKLPGPKSVNQLFDDKNIDNFSRGSKSFREYLMVSIVS
ncbi:hypothetical protein RF11_12759 [Thelohanellus kitauei]|uniref:Ubiquitin-like domain-containing protein n=1 Tax=Thelohanellus kitauei TaxID=669202 RepID=A0A0C2M2N6_THEKT|nr:hypothetical protein RF11_12759 [Thelohanellus kitauei]